MSACRARDGDLDSENSTDNSSTGPGDTAHLNINIILGNI